MEKLQLIVLLVVAHLFGSDGFVLNSDPCPSATPCRCYGTVINCASLRLTTMPSFNFTAVHYRTLKIDLRGNAFTYVPVNAFSNIHELTPTKVEILLQDNNITSLANAAFTNIENISLILDLSNNNLRTLPSAFMRLKRLEELRMLGNSLVFLDQRIMMHIGQSLKTLWLGVARMAIWPQELEQLDKLTELIVDEIPFHSLPSDAFHGLSSLQRLEITKSRLESIPEDLCYYSKNSIGTLGYFKFTEDHYILNNNQGLFKPCLNTNLVTSSVDLKKNQLYSFPSNVFTAFPGLLSLDVSYNNINHIDGNDVPSHLGLTTFYLSDNQFTSIPAIVSRMGSLRSLYISNNRITHVGDHIFSSLTKFEKLVMSGNPLVFIDPHAFSSLNTLKRLIVENTSLTSIPTAIIHSANRFSLLASNSPIQCTCDTMYFLKAWSSRLYSESNSYYGNCAGNSTRTTSLRSYIDSKLDNC